MENVFATLKVLSWNLGTLCVSFYRIRKIVGFFLEARSNSKFTLIKTKHLVIYHGNNNGNNNAYCGQRLRHNVQQPKNVGNHYYWTYFFLSGFSFTNIRESQDNNMGREGGYLFTSHEEQIFWANDLWGGYSKWEG